MPERKQNNKLIRWHLVGSLSLGGPSVLSSSVCLRSLRGVFGRGAFPTPCYSNGRPIRVVQMPDQGPG